VLPNKHLSWDNFCSTVLVSGQQRVHRITENPLIEVFYDGVDDRIGVLLGIPSGTAVPIALSRLSSISSRTYERNGKSLLEIATETSSLQRQFYHFVVAVAERITVEGRSATDAVGLELQSFADLFEQRSILGIEKQLGLLGELLFLERLFLKRGASAMDAWIGPRGEPHDFRIEGLEFEVKCASSSSRIHTIHGIDQLVPSPGCSLYLISVLVAPAGAHPGFSLVDKIRDLTLAMLGDTAREVAFGQALISMGYHFRDGPFYARRYISRRPIGLVPVDASFPAVTRKVITSGLGPLAFRIGALNYDVDVEGLEAEDGSEAFTNAVEP
jgi:hypothetical protein